MRTPFSAPPTTAGNTCITYLGRITWLVDGQHGDWAASYRLLTRERGLGHAQANTALVEAYRLGQPAPGEGRPQMPRPCRPETNRTP
ncbi:hypothetical protein DFP74_2993 [Nocardiopsis sp. Huas11]|nr:hypothetical protein DFP74_2993 [Nocardiopsis sp. Huas11]